MGVVILFVAIAIAIAQPKFAGSDQHGRERHDDQRERVLVPERVASITGPWVYLTELRGEIGLCDFDGIYCVSAIYLDKVN